MLSKLRKLLIKYEPIVRIYFYTTLILNIVFRERDPARRRVFWQVSKHTLVGYQRLTNAWELCTTADAIGLPGAVVECGVWRGGCAAVMAYQAQLNNPLRHSWFFDSFQGLPEPTSHDGDIGRTMSAASQTGKHSSIGQLITSQAVIEDLLFKKMRLKPEYIHIVPGWFSDVLPTASKQIGQIAVLRIDGDWYESTKQCLESLYRNVVAGGYIIIDDYRSWEGARKAVDEFITKHGIKAEITKIDRAGVYWQKIS